MIMSVIGVWYHLHFVYICVWALVHLSCTPVEFIIFDLYLNLCAHVADMSVYVGIYWYDVMLLAVMFK